MAATLLLVHSYLRWLVLAFGLYATARMAIGQSRDRVYTKADRGASLLFVASLDLQFLLGLLLFGVSPLTQGAMNNMSDAMKDGHVRFFIAEHPVMMTVAVAIAHAASVLAKKSTNDHDKFKKSGLGFALAMGLILAAIPWFRMGS